MSPVNSHFFSRKMGDQAEVVAVTEVSEHLPICITPVTTVRQPQHIHHGHPLGKKATMTLCVEKKKL